jgi:hypothetical protein
VCIEWRISRFLTGDGWWTFEYGAGLVIFNAPVPLSARRGGVLPIKDSRIDMCIDVTSLLLTKLLRARAGLDDNPRYVFSCLRRTFCISTPNDAPSSAPPVEAIFTSYLDPNSVRF